MIEIYMAGHGEYAKGIVSALDMLLGDSHGVTPVCAYSGEIASIHQLEAHLAQLAAAVRQRGHEMVLFTDIPGGSVNNSALKIAAGSSHIHLISGASLVMLLEFSMNENVPLAQRIALSLQASHGAGCYQNELSDFIALRETMAKLVHPDSAASC